MSGESRTRAIRLTREAARRLRLARAGRVVSVFARAINVALTEDDRGWLSLHGPGRVPSPFGVACTRLEPRPEWRNATVRLDPRELIVEGWLRVELTDAVVVDTTVPEAPAPPCRAMLAGVLAGSIGAGAEAWRPAPALAAGGLLPVAARVLGFGAPAGPSPAGPAAGAFARLAEPLLVTLARATRDRDLAGCLAAAGGLLGLGPGLTPSGDDALVGWIAGLHSAGPDARALVASARPALARLLIERTTPLSRAFLAAALDGVVGEPVRAFVERPSAATVALLCRVGATSGADVLAGYLLVTPWSSALRRGRG